MQSDDHVRSYFNALYRAWGPQHWWPGQSPFEVIVGAYLTQNTSWSNVERALANLRKARPSASTAFAARHYSNWKN